MFGRVSSLVGFAQELVQVKQPPEHNSSCPFVIFPGVAPHKAQSLLAKETAF